MPSSAVMLQAGSLTLMHLGVSLVHTSDTDDAGRRTFLLCIMQLLITHDAQSCPATQSLGP